MPNPHDVRFGARLAIEPPDGGAVSLLDTDYLLLAQPFAIKREVADDGALGPDVRGTGDRAGVEQSGPVGEVDLSFNCRGAALDYSPTVEPLELGRLLRAYGHQAVYRAPFGESPAMWLYVPSAGRETGAWDFQEHGRRTVFRRATVPKWSIGGDAAGFLTTACTVRGVITGTTDSEPHSALFYDVATRPFRLNGSGVCVTPYVSTWEHVGLRRWMLQQSWETTDRLSGRDDGTVVGFARGRRVTTLSMSVEAATLAADVNPYALKESGASVFLSLALRSGRDWLYLVSEQARLLDVQDDEDGSLALWNLTFQLHNRGNATPYYLWMAQR